MKTNRFILSPASYTEYGDRATNFGILVKASHSISTPDLVSIFHMASPSPPVYGI